MFLDGHLVRCRFEPVMPAEFFLHHNEAASQMELWHGTERVHGGIQWFGYGVEIDPKTGKIGAIDGRIPRVRVVFAGKNLDLQLEAPKTA